MTGSLATVAAFSDRAEAEVTRARLAVDGIEAIIQDDRERGLSPGFYSDFKVRVLVREEDLSRARAALGEEAS